MEKIVSLVSGSNDAQEDFLAMISCCQAGAIPRRRLRPARYAECSSPASEDWQRGDTPPWMRFLFTFTSGFLLAAHSIQGRNGSVYEPGNATILKV